MQATSRAAILFGAGVPFTIVVLLIDPGWWSLGFGYLGFATTITLFDILMGAPARQTKIDFQCPTAIQMGTDNEVVASLSLANSPRPFWFECLLEISGPAAPIERAIFPLDQNGELNVPFTITAEKRGVVTVTRLWIRSYGPWGLVAFRRVISVETEIPVIPDVSKVWMTALQFLNSDSPIGMIPYGDQGDGSEFDALREYVPGLDHRSIDWKRSARHRQLVCKEFRTEKNNNIVIGFDCGRLMSEPVMGMPRLDHAVNAGLILAYACLRNGDKVGVHSFGARTMSYTQPISGVHSFHRVQHTCSEITYTSDETNFTLGLADLSQRLNRRSLVILQTDFVDTITAELMIENIGRLARRHLVLFVCTINPDLKTMAEAPPASTIEMTRAVLAQDIIRERRIVIERLQRLGVLCLEVPVGALGTALVNRYIMIKRRELI